MSDSSSQKLLKQYLEELRSDESSRQKLRNKYQCKILELLIEKCKSQEQYDQLAITKREQQERGKRLNKKVLQLEQEIQRLKQEKTEQQLCSHIKGLELEATQFEDERQEMRKSRQQIEGELESQAKMSQVNLKQVKASYEQAMAVLTQKIAELQSECDSNQKTKASLLNQIAAITEKHTKQLSEREDVYEKEMRKISDQFYSNQKKEKQSWKCEIGKLEDVIAELRNNNENLKRQSEKSVEKFEHRLRSAEAEMEEIKQEKRKFEQFQDEATKLLKSKDKQLKAISKMNTDLKTQCEELEEQNSQIKDELAKAEAKRKQLQKRQAELKRQLEGISEEYSLENDALAQHKVTIAELREQVKKCRQQMSESSATIKNLESNLYKATSSLQAEQKKLQASRAQIEFLESSNVKLNQKLGFQENNRQNVVKSIVKDKQELEKANMKLLQLLEIKEKTIKAILSESPDIEPLRLQSFSANSQLWSKLNIEVLKDPVQRKKFINQLV